MTRRVLAIVAAASLAAAPAPAQRLFGNVVLADSTTPIVGAMIVARDSAGNEVGRELTGQRGAFVLPLPGAGRYDVRVFRVG